MQQITDTEYVDMYNIDDNNFWIAIEHIGRYSYASWFINKRRYDDVLDIACSNGYGCRMLGENSKSILGVDANESLIKQAREYNADIDNLEFQKIDVDSEDLVQMLNKKFSAIISFETIEHLIHPIKFLNNLSSLLKKAGRILLSVPSAEYEPVDDNGLSKNLHHRHVFDEDSLPDMFKDANLEIEMILGQSMINQLIRQHNTYVSRNKDEEGFTIQNFEINPRSIKYYVHMFSYPIKDDLINSYSRIYVLKKIVQ